MLTFRLTRNCVTFRIALVALLLTTVFSKGSAAQSTNASVSGRVTDQQNAVIPNVEVEIRNVDTGVTAVTKSNGDGIYSFPSLAPGNYLMNVRKEQFQTVSVTGVVLNVQDNLSRNFVLQVGSSAVSVTVRADDLHINTTDASVSTVVDRQFAENLPMNGRSFQALIQLTPGVVMIPSNQFDAGQFSVNGQRASANYWMIDGTSANTGINWFYPGNGLAGSLGSFGVTGGTNSLVSVDALQEFRIQTSTYAPEFGRTPGGQISIVTRSGTNRFHGVLFDYFRNDALDANDWFAGYAHNPPLRKPPERQNDFGGTFSGPILRNRTFFFFSYEGLRLRLPQIGLTTVPDLAARQNAIPSAQPWLNAYPLPNGTDNIVTGVAQFNSSYSNRSVLDAYSMRVDHRISDKLTLFGRYNYSPSELLQRGLSSRPLSTVGKIDITTQTGTIGATWAASSAVASEWRLNYSETNAFSASKLDNFGGAIPPSSLPFPPSFDSNNSLFVFGVFSLSNASLVSGFNGRNRQRQINTVGNISVQKGSHELKFGVDFRRLSPVYHPYLYDGQAYFTNVADAMAGRLRSSVILASQGAAFSFRNLGAFAQDTWRASSRLTLTYGLRWDIDFAPSTINGPNFLAVSGFDPKNLSSLAVAPAGASLFATPYKNFAPRFGVAYQLSQSPQRQTVFRSGFGVFYDLATSEVGSLISFGGYPFAASKSASGGTFPFSPAVAAPPAIVVPDATNHGILAATDPNLKLPYTLQWSAALEQALGRQQVISATYIGSVGRRLLQSELVFSPNPTFGRAYLAGNFATSDYDALQIQLQRRLSRGFQGLASYSWSHSIDTASASSAVGNKANALVSAVDPNSNRAASDFDIRHEFSAGITYDIPTLAANAVGKAIVSGWSLETVIQIRSAPPVDIYNSKFSTLLNSFANVRPDVVPGVPLYLYGNVYPGGVAFNPAAFTNPPTSSGGTPIRQGNFGRNVLRGFGAGQWDFAVHRDFPIRESLALQFRAEMFNVLNHPNFGTPVADLNNPQFGRATQMLAQQLGGANPGGGGFSPLYQIGGPRSIQLALKLRF